MIKGQFWKIIKKDFRFSLTLYKPAYGLILQTKKNGHLHAVDISWCQWNQKSKAVDINHVHINSYEMVTKTVKKTAHNQERRSVSNATRNIAKTSSSKCHICFFIVCPNLDAHCYTGPNCQNGIRLPYWNLQILFPSSVVGRDSCVSCSHARITL